MTTTNPLGGTDWALTAPDDSNGPASHKQSAGRDATHIDRERTGDMVNLGMLGSDC